METKNWWTSKTFYLGLVSIAGGIVEFIYGLPASASIGTVIGGILVIVIRAFTNTAIGGTPGAKPKE